MKEHFWALFVQSKQLMVVILWLLPHCLPLQCHYGLSRDCTFASTGWLGRYSPRSSRPRETGPADRPSNAKIYTLNSTIINTISKMNRRIVLKFCIRIEEKILRTFSCWHFSEKNVLHGFFWVFLVFSHLSHLWLINHWIKGHFQHEGMPVAAKCTFTKIINSQRTFERCKKFSPRGHPKCRKVPKYFFGLNHFDEIVDLSSRNGPHGLGP